MKKNFAILVLAMMAVVVSMSVASCDEATSVSKGYTQGIYTVDRNFLRPENVDTFYTLKKADIESFGLKDGDRAIVTLGYEIDNVVGAKNALWYIKSVDEILPVFPLTPASEVDKAVYSSAIAGVGSMPMYGPYWMWRGYQNIYVGYYGNGEQGDFKMSPVGMSGDTICFELNSLIAAGDVPTKQLLTFDLRTVASMLSEEDATKLAALDSVCTKVTTNVEMISNGATVIKSMALSGGKYKRTF